MKALFAVFMAVALVLLLGGCALPPVVAAPTAAEIGAAREEVAAAHLAPQDYVNFGVTLADRSCNAKFSALVEEAQNTAVATQTLSMAGAAATIAGGPAGNAAGALLPLLAAALGNYQSSRPGGISPALVRGLVKRTQTAWLTQMPTPLSDGDAFALVQSYAELCQTPAVLQAIHDAMSSAVVTAASPNDLPAAAGALRSAFAHQYSGGRVSPPVVRINPPVTAAAPAVVAQAVSDAQFRKMQAEWLTIQKRGGRNAAEGGPRFPPPPITVPPLPEIPRAALPESSIPPAPAAPMAVAPLPPPQPADAQPVPQPKPRWKF